MAFQAAKEFLEKRGFGDRIKEKQRGIYKIIHHKKGMMVDHIAKFLGRIYMDPQNFNIKGMFYFFPSAQ